MAKIRFFMALFVFCFFCYGFTLAQNFAQKVPKPKIETPDLQPKVGESLFYTIRWLGVPVGKVSLEVKDMVKVSNRDCYHITAEARPNNLLKKFVDLAYQVDSFVDKELLVSRRFKKERAMDGKYNYVIIDFNPEENTADYKSEGGGTSIKVSDKRSDLNINNPSTDKIPGGTQDLLSVLYYLRQINVEEGENYPVNIYYGGRNWEASFVVGQPYWRDIRKKGTFPVFKFTPSSELNDFILGRRTFSISLTCDSRRVPLEFSFSTGIGSITARLDNIPE